MMEPTINSTVNSDTEAVQAIESKSRGKIVVLIVAGIGLLAFSGYFMFSPGSDGSSTGARNSPQMKQFLQTIGMGPKAGAYRFIAPSIGVFLSIAIALSILSKGGRDLQTAKLQSKKVKQDHAPAPSAQQTQPIEDELECNLASYKLFLSTGVIPDPKATELVQAVSPAPAVGSNA